MGDGITEIAGIEIPSTNPAFLTVVGVHVLLGLACVVTGAIAMLSEKRAGRHPRNGTIYFWCSGGVFLTAASLAAVRWTEDYHLFVLGTLSFAAACLGREARRRRWRHWIRLHITGMGASYLLLLIAFYGGQRQEPAALEGTSSGGVLAAAGGRRDSPDPPRLAPAPAGSSAGFSQIADWGSALPYFDISGNIN
jgi:hypothetical protein